MTPTPSPQPPVALYQPGDIVGGYEVLALIGRGGFSQVFKVQSAEGRFFALKVMALSELSTNEVRDAARLSREANTLSKIRHPNIVRYENFELDPVTNRLFLVLEFIEGVTLRQLMHTQRLQLAEIVDIGIGIAAALGELHERALIHRDVKPENVMVTPSGDVKLLDLGIIKAQGVSQGTTRPLGTSLYMSPEALEHQEITPPTDIYALGHVLYELLAGVHAFTEPDKATRGLAQAEVLVKHLTEQRFRVTPLRERNEHLPEALTRCVEQAMLRNPLGRQPNGKAMRIELDNIRRRLVVQKAANNAALHSHLSEIGVAAVDTAWLMSAKASAPASTFVPTAMTQPVDPSLIPGSRPHPQIPKPAKAHHGIAIPSDAQTLQSAILVAEPVRPPPATLDPTTSPSPPPTRTSWLDLIDRQHLYLAVLGLVLGGVARLVHVWLL